MAPYSSAYRIPVKSLLNTRELHSECRQAELLIA